MAREMVLNALVVFLLAVILFMCWLHACGRWRQWRSAEETGEDVAEHDQPLKAVQRKGLDKAMIDALPTFIYSSNDENLQGSTDGEEYYKGDERSAAASPNDQFQILQGSEDALKGWTACSRRDCSNIIVECPVCLCEFQHMEKGRVLPNCRHRFHVDCIDTWLRSNATCPVCRASCADQSAAAAEVTAEDGVPLLQVITSSPRNGVELSHSAQGRSFVQYPTNVLFWGSDSLVSSRINVSMAQAAHTPATSAPSTIIQIHTQVLQPLQAAAPSLSLSSPPSRITRLNSLRRLLTRERQLNIDPGYIIGASSKA